MSRWDWGLNKKRCAYFFFPKDDNDLRLVPGDELKLRHRAPSARQPWEMVGHVTRFDTTEEVCLEMNGSVSETTNGYGVGCGCRLWVWAGCVALEDITFVGLLLFVSCLETYNYKMSVLFGAFPHKVV